MILSKKIIMHLVHKTFRTHQKNLGILFWTKPFGTGLKALVSIKLSSVNFSGMVFITSGISPLSISWNTSALTLLEFLFYIGVEMTINAVLVPGVQQSDSVIHVRASILFHYFPALALTGYWVELPVLCGRSLLVICFKYSSDCMSTPAPDLSLFAVVKTAWFSWLDLLYVLWSDAHLDRVFSSRNLLFQVWWFLWLILKHQCYLQCCNPSRFLWCPIGALFYSIDKSFHRVTMCNGP